MILGQFNPKCMGALQGVKTSIRSGEQEKILFYKGGSNFAMDLDVLF